MIGYANGNLGKQILFGTLDLTLLFYFTDVLGMDPLFSGIIIFISMLVDATLDPIVGYFIDKFQIRYGIYILIGSVFYSLSFVLLFSVSLLGFKTIASFGAILILFRLSYTLIDVPHNALIARLFKNGDMRTKVSAYRFLFSSCGGLIIAFAISPILLSDVKGNETERFFYFSIFAATISFISLAIVARVALRYETKNNISMNTSMKLIQLINVLLKNKQLHIALIVCLFTGLCSPILAKGILYFAKYYLQNEKIAGIMLPAIMFGQIISLPFWVKITRYYSKKTSLQLSHGLLFLAALLLLWVNPQSQVMVVLLAFVAGFAYGAIYMVIWSLLADVADYQQVTTKIRADAVLFALAIMIMKLSLGFGNVLFGSSLELIGYQPDMLLTEKTANNVAFIVCIVPIIGSLACIWTLHYYRITTKLQRRWQKQLFK